MTNLGLLKSIYNYYSNQSCLVILTYIMLLFFCLELIFIIKTSQSLKSQIKKIEEDENKKDKFLINLISDYKKIMHNKDSQLIDTEAFIDSFLARKKTFLLHIKEILKQSDYIFILTGLFSSFIIILFGIINLNLEEVTGLNDFFSSLNTLLLSLKPALIIMTLSIIFALLSNLLLRFWNLDYRFNILKKVLIDYLLNNIDNNNNLSNEKKLLSDLIKTIEKNTLAIDENINNKLVNHIQSLEKNINKSQLEKVEEDFHENISC